MAQPPPSERENDKGEAEPDVAVKSGSLPNEASSKFKELTRRPLSVTHDEIKPLGRSARERRG